MKSKLEQLKLNFEKLKAISELYGELMSREIANEKELEESKLRYEAMKNQALKILMHSKKIVGSIESEDIP